MLSSPGDFLTSEISVTLKYQYGESAKYNWDK